MAEAVEWAEEHLFDRNSVVLSAVYGRIVGAGAG